MLAILFLVLAFWLGAGSFENGNPVYAVAVFLAVALPGIAISCTFEVVMKELLAPYAWYVATRLRAALLPARPRRSSPGPSS